LLLLYICIYWKKDKFVTKTLDVVVLNRSRY